MSTLLWLAFFIGTFIALTYKRINLKTSTLVLGGAMLFYSLFAASGLGWKLLMWLLFLGIAVPLNLEDFRQQFITAPILDYFRKILPEMSDTEKTALDAGTVWWDGELFGGRPNWHRFLSFPAPRLSEEEQAFMDGPVAELCEMLDEWQITHEEADIPEKAWKHLKKHRFFAMIIPKEYGGLDYSATCHSRVLARVAASGGGATAASIVAVPNSLGPAELILKYGTDDQKNHYLPRLASGEEIPCFGLTSPWAGSDAGAIPDYGIVCKGKWNGKTVLGMKLTFDKRYITLAPVATVVGLAFKMYDPDGLLGEQEDLGITCALIPRDTAGLEIGRRHLPLNNPFQNGPIRAKELFVPIDFIIGGQEMAGQGWRMLMECLAVGRSISLPSMSIGGATGAANLTGAYARIRKQFNVSIGDFEGIQEGLARIGALTYAGDATRAMTAGAVDLGEKPAVPSAIAKCHCTDMARRIQVDAMDIHGGKGVMLGPSNYLGRAYQGTPIAVTVEGANILTRSMMIYGQGAIRCHPFVLKEMQAAFDEDAGRGLHDFDQAFWGHIGHDFMAASRSLVLGVTRSMFTSVPVDGPTKKYFRKITRYSANLALLSDVCMGVYGGSLKFRESTSARLGDVLSYMYIASATLKRFEEQGRPAADLPMVQWVCEDLFFKIEQQLDGVIRHLPVAPLGWLMRLVIFPLGRRAKMPDDRTGTKIAQLLQEPGEPRDRLSANCHIPGDTDTPLGLLNVTLDAVIANEELEKRVIRAAKDGKLKSPHPWERIDEAEKAGIVNKKEAGQMRDTLELVERVIRVDDFDTSEMRAGKKTSRAAAQPDTGKPAAKKTAKKASKKAPRKTAKTAKTAKKAAKKSSKASA